MDDLIYARQSVDKEDSISIESQIELCLREIGNNPHRVFRDKGYSGKNTERPDFQEMMALVRSGGVRRIVVYRLDRISRSVLDFANVISELQKYGVEFVSITERFDTSTPIGKAMLMIVMVFAQLERETIQQRVIDAYRSRSRKGYYMGGRVPYGFLLENTIMDGIKTCMYKPIPEQMRVVELIYSLYALPQVSFGDIIRYLSENGIKNQDCKNFSRMRIRDIVTNPVYVKADAAIFEFFRGQGTEVVNDVSQFIGTNGAYLYTGSKSVKRKAICLDGQVLVIAPHEGCIESETWIRCRRKCLNVRQIAKPVKAKNTWLAGKIKCIDCGHALSLKTYQRKRSQDARYYICNSKYVSASCDGVGAVQADEIEDIVFDEMTRKLSEFNELSYKERQGDPIELTRARLRAEEIEKEIAILIDKIVSASTTTMEYINERIDALDEEKKAVKEKIAQLSAEMYDRSNVGSISGYMSNWGEVNIDDKLSVVDTLIESIHVGHGKVQISWKI
ncbi:MAG: recombinase family protein [Clostridia bacterium]